MNPTTDAERSPMSPEQALEVIGSLYCRTAADCCADDCAACRQEHDAVAVLASIMRRYLFWRKHYKCDFVLVLGGDGPGVRFDPHRPMVELLGDDYEARIDRALDAAMSPNQEPRT